MAASPRISALISDVDGTVVTSRKDVAPGTRAVAAKLRERGIPMAIISGRPPLGMRMLIEPLKLTTPIAGFNGGAFTREDMSVIEERPLPPAVAAESVEFLQRRDIEVWVFASGKWYVRDPDRPHVIRERHAVQFDPIVVADFSKLLDDAHKVVGISDDIPTLVQHEREMAGRIDGKASASRSQPYYLDITHPLANKGDAVGTLARLMGVTMDQVAVIGDGLNDVGMFAKSPLSIAMGNASDEVKGLARFVTGSNDEEGWASAIEKHVLGGGG
ncbi:MAG: HAD family phosphatase [Alphaproteobacteria bacterium]|nr:HAD family phosphatase [Alphaproteobacteria bacterium]